MAVNQLLVKSYAINVYRTGMNSLTNIGINRPEYVEPIKLYAAQTYWIEDIDNALVKSWITPTEHAETLALKVPTDPQNRPPIEFMAIETV